MKNRIFFCRLLDQQIQEGITVVLGMVLPLCSTLAVNPWPHGVVERLVPHRHLRLRSLQKHLKWIRFVTTGSHETPVFLSQEFRDLGDRAKVVPRTPLCEKIVGRTNSGLTDVSTTQS